MTQSKRSAVTFAHDGRSLTYKLSANAMCAYEDAQGESVIDAAIALEGAGESGGAGFQFRRLRSLFWAGLPSGTSLEDAGDIMDDLGMEEAVEIIMKGVTLAFPEARDEEAPAPGNARGAKKKA